MALGSTQPLTEMSTSNLLGGRGGGKGGPARKADNLTATCDQTRENMGTSTSHITMGLHSLLQG
jgi:hypothetical protein